jgi:hypothetical protein
MHRNFKAILLTAACTGLLGGTGARLNAQPTGTPNASSNVGTTLHASVTDFSKKEKHACKGQNSCKGKGGCKSSDNGCKGKNSCKGKGGCATDGSKPPA